MGRRFEELDPNLSYSKFVFTDEEKRKEWESLDPITKKCITLMLRDYCKKAEAHHSIDLL